MSPNNDWKYTHYDRPENKTFPEQLLKIQILIGGDQYPKSDTMKKQNEQRSCAECDSWKRSWINRPYYGQNNIAAKMDTWEAWKVRLWHDGNVWLDKQCHIEALRSFPRS